MRAGDVLGASGRPQLLELLGVEPLPLAAVEEAVDGETRRLEVLEHRLSQPAGALAADRHEAVGEQIEAGIDQLRSSLQDLPRGFQADPLAEFRRVNVEGTRSVLEAAADAGAELVDLEYVQFHPTALASGRDPLPLLTEALRGEGALARENLEKIAGELGLDMAKFKSALDTRKHKAKVEADAKVGNDAGINGTPGFVIADRILRGATDLETLQTLIRQARVKR